MQKVQNTATRMVLNKHQTHSATECLKQLYWLPIKSRIDYKVLTIVFKCKHGMAPKYLQDLLEAKENQRQGLKSNNKQLLKVPTTRKTFADRSFSVKGPKLWNDLPDSIRTITSYAEFKKQLKTHLFDSTLNNTLVFYNVLYQVPNLLLLLLLLLLFYYYYYRPEHTSAFLYTITG